MIEQSKYNVGYTVGTWFPNPRFNLSERKIFGNVRKKVCIVGFEEAVNPQAPMNDPEWEIWGLNHANRLGFMKDDEGKLRVDRWFDLHEEHAQSPEDLEWTHTCPVPIYLTSLYTENPMALVYPLEEVMCKFSRPAETGHQPDYWCSSFAYMLALAAYEGFKEIRISGVNLNFGRELPIERGNLEYWMGYLRGLGYCITTPSDSKLCRHPYRYGFQYIEEKEWVEQRMANLIFELLGYPEIADLFQKGMKERHEAMKASGQPYQVLNLDGTREQFNLEGVKPL